ncbi:Alpha/Beta hydrolase protein [Rhodocollybia butyracea]|uniref:Carboxylic ester hydrolase n=1 Tax=Rhodocollybia butyracea TaxID=206335 RepID=A0A9P5UDP5_9AGAR|nr:Alpha/Beta hydrolase protein [Rhodocollybia butyracea]
MAHLHDELASNSARVEVETRYGKVIGGRASNGTAVFLGADSVCATPVRFADAEPLPNNHRYPPGVEYLTESSYCFQPHNDGQAGDTPFPDKVGYGNPTENPLFLNIICPPSFDPSINETVQAFPVKIYIHGGFLQFGSPHGLRGQDQFVSAEFSEVRVNIGYRLSAFGYLACDKPRLNGNYGFKDQWLALEWVKKNIDVFGGDPHNVQILGLSAGAHSVHQILHHVSRLPESAEAPFQSAILIMAPKTPAELNSQFEALCRALHLDPHSPDILNTLRDTSVVPASKICEVIETDAIGTEFGTFRGCVDNVWMASSPDIMTWQRSGQFAKNLKEKGIKSIVVGDLTEEWYLYSIAHPISCAADVAPNLERYFPAEVVQRMMKMYRQLGDDAEQEECVRLFGDILSDWQVHLPVRVLARDLHQAGFPFLRYEIAWTPEQIRPEGGYVTHGGDGYLWHLRVPDLTTDQVEIAKNWLKQIDKEVKILEKNGLQSRSVKDILKLGKDREISWSVDQLWDDKMRHAKILAGEQGS